MEERSLAREMSAQRRALVDSPLCAQWGPSAKVAGMFLEDIDCFDRRLFSLSPLALVFTDPRQRLLLEAVWTAIEDAGLKKSELAGKKVGVFVAHDGWYLGSYVKRIPTEHLSNQEFIVPGNDPCFLANRISSVFDFHGPSMVFDTTCSGTYVALHHACQSLKNRECEYAIIGAVTLFLDPWKDGETIATPFESLSPDMRSFAKDATGYRTSEGCGAILLQRSTTAVDERHNVYGVICASGYNSGGKTNSFAQPSLAQQVGLFKEVLNSSKLSPDQIDYVEAHGVASTMGDATEANALIEVFQRQASPTPCYVSTIKPNLGHNHASSGIYSLLKAVLSLRHDHIPPIRGLRGSLLNEEIPKDTKGVQFLTQAVDWPKKYCDNSARAPRYVFLTSYGFSNVNAAIVLKEHIPVAHATEPPHRSGDRPGSQVMICLSAQSTVQLRQQLSQLRKFIDKSKESGEELSRFDLAYTLQVGREAMSHRWVAIVESIQALESALKAFLDGLHDGTTQSFAAKTEEKKSVLALLLENRTALGQKISEAITAKDFAKLADFWLTGVELDWDRCYDQIPKRMHMPTYPFAKEHYWVPRKEVFESANTVATSHTLLHPLLHSNTSTASQQQFSSTFSGEEFFLADHVIGGQRILPGVAHLEMVRAALHRAANVADGARSVTLKNVVWARPLTVPHSAKEVHIRLFPQVDGDVHYEIYTEASNSEAGEVVHSEGVAVLQPSGEAPRLDLPALLAEMHAETISAEQLYTIPERLSLYIGARLRGVTQAHRGDRQVLAKIVLPDSVSDTRDQFFLHPSMADPVLQLAYLGLVMKLNEDIPLTIPFSLQECKLYAACTPSMWVWIRYAPDSMPGDTVQKLDIDLCDDAGSVCMKMRNFCFRSREVEKTSAAKKRNTIAPPAQAARGDSVAPTALYVKAAEYFKRILSSTLHLPVHEIHTEQTFDKYGIDSLMVVRITNQLEKTFGSLPKTLFFEYRSVGELAAYFLQEHGDTLRAVLGVAAAPAARSELPMHEVPHEPTDPERDLPIRVAPERVRNRDTGAWDIAIIGLSGRYPRAKNLQEYWKNLRDGIDCITEVPSERWNWREYYTADRSRPGCHYSRWGGFIDDVDKFDPLFFSIPPREAELMDPQERLFLQHVWMALEDAGYSRDTLARELRESTADPGENPAIGVYAGVMYGEYQLLGAESSIRGERVGFASTLGSIANRVSYVLDLHGPSITIDTQCSSSLTAIHLACQDLRLGNAGLAIAGGVNVTIHPNKYLELSRRQFISTKGHCESFGEGGDGYIPGEGVGVAVLKRLADAQRDGDHVYGVIKGSAINHGGKTNGYTVPSPNAQQAAIAGALRQARIDPRTVSYIEAHGTGTKLGDPIEIAGLTKAFYKNSDSSTGMKQYCWIGSVKSNIGHCESAAGIAGITKVLLQMKFSKIVPSLHSRTLNPNIDFSSTPFKVNQELRDWTRLEREDEQGNRVECPRIAGVSSFGAGGSNAHILIEEYVDAPQGNSSVSPSTRPDTPPDQVMIPLSARNPERLHDVARNLRDFLQQESHVELPSPGSPAQSNADKPLSLNIVDLAYTLQVGRDPMEERLGLIVGSVEELMEKLSAYLVGDSDIEGVYSARESNDKDFLETFASDEDVGGLIETWVAKRKYSRLIDLWVKGFAIDWRALYRGAKPQRLSLPTYPFAKERYWAPEAKAEFAHAAGTLSADCLILHPLLHQNTSDFSEQRFSSAFTGEEFFLADHVVRGEKVLPGAAALEMARAAIARAARGWSENGAGLSLKHVVWSRPIVVSGGVQEVHIGLFPAERRDADSAAPEQIQFRIYSELKNESLEVVVHAQGVCEMTKPGVESALDIEALRAGMRGGVVTAEQCYQRFESLGIHYGATHRGIQEIYLGDDQILARLSLPLALRGDGTREASTASAFVLHPSLIDSALQATIGLDAVRTSDSPPLKPSVPFALDRLDVVGDCTAEMWAWARRSGSTSHSDPVQKFDIDVCDDQGSVRVRIRGLSTRALEDKMDVRISSDFEGALLAAPFWKEEPVPTHTQPTSDMRRSILLCELSGIVVADIEAKIPDSTCLSLWSEKNSRAARFQDYATTIFERLKNAVRDQQLSTAAGNVQIQIVVPGTNEQRHLRALLGLVKAAALENPSISGQLIVAEAGETAEGLGEKLQENRYCTETSLIRYRQGTREVLSWRELEWYKATPDLPWRDRGTYLITGGLGGLGVLFSREILRQAEHPMLILTGRSALDVEKQASLEALRAGGNRVEYRQVDVADAHDVERLVQNLVGEYGSLQGIIHSAGIVRDNFIRKKTIEELEGVFAPKVAGTLNLDEVTKALNLDFFVLCSSVAGALGNAGQSDYCTANAFMDQYAHYRNELVTTGARRGRTLSLNWPLWEEGGMRVSDAVETRIRQSLGMVPMQTAVGMSAFYAGLASQAGQVMVMQGDLPRLRSMLRGGHAPEPAKQRREAENPPAQTSVNPSRFEEATADYLKQVLSSSLKLPAGKIDAHSPFEKYGIDSVLVMEMTNQLAGTFGAISNTLFYEYLTIAELAKYFVAAHADTLRELLAVPEIAEPAAPPPAASVSPGRIYSSAGDRFYRSSRDSREQVSRPANSPGALDIAIIGVSGRYPQARHVGEFWENLRAGKDCITEVPLDRWDWREYYPEDKNQPRLHASKWGGFITGVDEFDAAFFDIPGKEAEIMDPQERLFLEHVWASLEDAGYTRATLREKERDDCAGDVGVYVGVMYGEYQLYGAQDSVRGTPRGFAGSLASISNRVSYVLDLHGPSMTLDTMCSSSLTAIHLACQDLRQGHTALGIAGGVNLSLHPNKYVMLSTAKLISSEARCESFGIGGSGYVPGEGVGVVLLKRLADAQRDGDHIYGVIKGSAINHGGKTNGYCVPNPNAQRSAIDRALREAAIDPRQISYIEAHGTGTKLGDPIEISALTKAFRKGTTDSQFCWIGSAKSNIGHCESAAGVAALTKVLLQMRHGQLAPSLHSATLNPNIDFAQTPFIVNRELRDWQRPVVDGKQVSRIAGISAFGAGGSNAHLIVEEYCAAAEETSGHIATPGRSVLIPLSAKTPDRLRAAAANLLEYTNAAIGKPGAPAQRTQPAPDIADLSYTLQIGREAMDERLALIVGSLEDLQEKLRGFLAGKRDIHNLFRGRTKPARDEAPHPLTAYLGDEDIRTAVDSWISKKKYAKLLDLWVSGLEIDWSKLYGDVKPKRICLPTYPFAQVKYWWSGSPAGTVAPDADAETETALVPVEAVVAKKYFDGLSGSHLSSAERIEIFIVTLLRSLLNADAVDINADTTLTSLSLESIHVVGFVDFWRATLGKAIPVTLFYETQTIGQLRDYIVTHGLATDADLDSASRILRADQGSRAGVKFQLSDMQESFVVGRNLPTLGQSVSSTIYLELVVDEALDFQRLQTAWSRIVRYHEVLHMKITADFQQEVMTQIPEHPIASRNLAASSAQDEAEQLLAVRQEMAYRTFDLEQWPYFDVRVSYLRTKRCVIHLAIDEVLVDGYSTQLITQQLQQLYRDPESDLPALQYSFRQYLDHLRAMESEAGYSQSMRYWKQRLQHLPPAPAIPSAVVAGANAKVHCLQGELETRLWSKIKAKAQHLGCYPSTVLLRVFCNALREHTRQDAFCINITNLNRLPLHRDVMRLAGMFINSSVYVYRHEENAPFEMQVLAQQRQLEADSSHAHVGATRVLRELKNAGQAGPVVPLSVVFTSLISTVFHGLDEKSGWQVSNVINTTPQVHVDHQVLEKGGTLHYRWYVADALFQRKDIHSIFERYGRMLQQAAESAESWSIAADGDEDTEPFPLSNQQTAYAFGRSVQFQHGGRGCVFQAEYEVACLNLAQLNQAWNDVVRHHPMLRTVIQSSGEQRTLDAFPEYSIEEAECATTEEDFAARCEEIRERMLANVYPLDSYPYFSIRICRREGGRSRIFINIDLMIADGKSLMRIIAQLWRRYLDPRYAFAPCHYSFREYALFRQRQRHLPEFAAQLQYWQHKLSQIMPGPRQIQDSAATHARTQQITCTFPYLRELREKSKRLGVGINSVMLAAYGETLLQWNRGLGFSIVVVKWDREPLHSDIDAVVGDFTRLSWVSFDATADGVDVKIRRVQEQLDRDEAHRLVDGMEALRKVKGLSLPVVYTNVVEDPELLSMGLSEVTPVYAISHTPNVVLDNISSIVSDTAMKIQWDTILDAQGKETEMFHRYIETLKNWAHEATAEAPAAVPPEVLAVPAQGVCLHELFEQVAAKLPQQCAVRFEGESVSYRELAEKTDQCAQWLLRQGIGPDDVVAVFMQRSIELVVALMGILRAGAAYLPIDVLAPGQRAQLILQDAKAKCVLTQTQFAHKWDEYPGMKILCLDDFPRPATHEPVERQLPAARENNLAYVVYTSGSTGVPKGCMIEHRSIVNRLSWMQSQFPLRVGDAVLQKTPYTFDVSVWEFFWPLIVGASVVVAKPGGHLDTDYLLDVIAKEKIGVCHFVPSMLRPMLQERDLHRMSGMQRVVVSGEALDYDLFEEFASHFSMPLENLYGPTEAAVDVSYWPCRKNSERRTYIGKAISGIRLYILDESMQPVEPGKVGELYIAGVGVGRGYLNNPELTAKSFLLSPFDPNETLYKTGDLASAEKGGEILYHGRSDAQIKLHGLRIELEDIEQHIRPHHSIEDVVVAVRDFHGQQVLAAYVVACDRSSGINEDELRHFLHERLPGYMIPHVWVEIEAIPLTEHGKQDRKRLPALNGNASGRSAQDKNAARSNVDARLYRILHDLLEGNTVSRDYETRPVQGHIH